MKIMVVLQGTTGDESLAGSEFVELVREHKEIVMMPHADSKPLTVTNKVAELSFILDILSAAGGLAGIAKIIFDILEKRNVEFTVNYDGNKSIKIKRAMSAKEIKALLEGIAVNGQSKDDGI